ncbi:MAG: carbon-nitrogen hydrolase family protein, partial [Bacteroidota bacterium]
EKGQLQVNLENHLKMIAQARQAQADLIVFPELSLTGYEPDLAKELARDLTDEVFQPLQAAADQSQLGIGAGMPTQAPDGINISMLIFQPEKERIHYSKRILHADERLYFVPGHHQPLLHIKGKKIALGICYETLQREHFVQAVAQQADMYIASVAKPDRGVNKAYLHFPSIAREFNIPILMANSVGYCDNFMSNGQSSVWNGKGELMGQLGGEEEGLLVYDTELDIVLNSN